jgi:hypothetical protein
MNAMIEGLEERRLMANPHFLGEVEFNVLGTSLNATGSVAGLGNADVTVVLSATGTATIVCTNPAGKVAPGQTREVNVSGSQTITDVKNGRVNFDVSTVSPVAPQEACPNRKWTASIKDVDFSSATLIVQQGGEDVLSETVDL